MFLRQNKKFFVFIISPKTADENRNTYEDKHVEYCNISGAVNVWLPIPVAVRSMAWVCSHSFAGTASSNSVGSVDVCLLRMLFVVR
jgi:hypothetical protein